MINKCVVITQDLDSHGETGEDHVDDNRTLELGDVFNSKRTSIITGGVRDLATPPKVIMGKEWGKGMSKARTEAFCQSRMGYLIFLTSSRSYQTSELSEKSWSVCPREFQPKTPGVLTEFQGDRLPGLTAARLEARPQQQQQRRMLPL